MQLAAAMALYAQMHETRPYHSGDFKSWAKERSRDYPFRYDDGVSFYLSETEVNPDDDWLGDGRSVAEQAVGDVGEGDQGE